MVTVSRTVSAVFVGLGMLLPGSGLMAQDKQLVFGFSNAAINNTMLASVERGIKRAIEGHGAKLITYDGQWNVEKQTNDVDDMILAGVDGAIILPTDGVVAMSWVEKLNEKKIPVIGAASPIGPKDDIVAGRGTYVFPGLLAQGNTNDFEAGFEVGKFSAALLPKDRPGKVAFIEGAPGTITNTVRNNGFTEGLDKSGAKYTIVSDQPTDWSAESAEAACQNILAANPDIDVFYTHADILAQGCSHAIEQNGSSAATVSPSGGAAFAVPLIEAGAIKASVCMQTETIGREIGEALYDYVANGKKPKERFITIPTILYTKDNLGDCKPEW